MGQSGIHGSAFSIGPDGLRQASRDLRSRVVEKAAMRASMPWASVAEVEADKVADAIEELNRVCRARWANLQERFVALSDIGMQAADLYETSDQKVVDDANSPLITF